MSRFNPAYIAFATGTVITALVGLGLVILTDIQVDLIFKAVAGVLLIFGVSSIPAAGAAMRNEEEAFTEGLNTPVPTSSKNPSSY